MGSSSNWPIVLGMVAIALAAVWYDAQNEQGPRSDAGAGQPPPAAVAAQAMR